MNIREYAITGVDITDALNNAIDDLSSSAPYGGQILIPHGIWQSRGGHTLDASRMSISIEGAGYNHNPSYWGTEIVIDPESSGSSEYMFRVRADNHKTSLKNLAISMAGMKDGVGLLLTNLDGKGTSGNIIYATCLENVGFNTCDFGIKVASAEKTQYECILNRFERCSFITCGAAFYCNTINGGYSFDTCYFSLPAGGVAFDCQYVGNLSVDHCLVVGNQDNDPGEPATDGTTILKAAGQFNNISFYDCQDENIQYAYRKVTYDYAQVPIVYRNCIIQSKLRFEKDGAVVFDSCRIFDCDGAGDCTAGTVEDTATGAAKVFLKGLNNVYTPSSQTEGSIASLVNSDSAIVYESKGIGKPYIASTTASTYTIGNATRGIVTVPLGQSYVVVYSDLLDNPAYLESMVFVQLRTYDSGGARIREVANGQGYFQINLTKEAVTNLSVAFKIESCEKFFELGDVGT